MVTISQSAQWRLAAVIFWAVLFGQAVASASDFAATVQSGRAKLDASDPTGALVEFRRAMAIDPAAAEGYFYAAIASYRLGDLDEAARLGDEALRRASGEEAGRMREVVTLIGQKRTAATKRAEGDAAYGDGLMAKAAQAYADAFAADPNAGEVGLKAAGLFADRLGRLLDAAVIWQRVVRLGGEAATAANEELARRHAELTALLGDALRREPTWRRNRDVAEPRRLAEAFPGNLGLQVLLASLHAEARDEGRALEHLKQASRLGLPFADFMKEPALRGLIVARPNGAVATFVADAFGADRLAEVRQVLAREEAERKRREAEKAEEATLPAWRDAERLSVVRELDALLSAQPAEPLREHEHNRYWVTYRTPAHLKWDKGQYVLSCTYDRDVVDISLRATVPNVRLDKQAFLPSFSLLKTATIEPLVFTRRLVNLKLTFSQPIRIWQDKADRHRKPADSYWEMLDAMSIYTSARDDAETQRLLRLFRRLRQLDAAGNDPAKLRQAKHGAAG
jgi:tetratricopeptide (TPR) repeat protein